MRRSKTNNDGWFWTNLRIYTPMRSFGLVLVCMVGVVACGREAAVSNSMNDVDLSYVSSHAPTRAASAEPDVAQTAGRVKALLQDEQRRNLSPQQRDQLRSSIDSFRSQVGAAEHEVRRDRRKLEGQNATAAVERATNVLTGIQRQTRAALVALDALSASGERSKRLADQAIKALAPFTTVSSSHPLSNRMAFKSDTPSTGNPPLSAGVTPAYAAPQPSESASPLPRVPSAEDLQPTPDTAPSSEVTALAEQLDHDPVKLYDYVYNRIDYQAYYGSRKNPGQTLLDSAGSDADQAALLVALLRASGDPARVVHGVVEIPIATAMNRLGLDAGQGHEASAAAEVLSAGGVPVTELRSGGTVKALRVERVWAEAFVSSKGYRGVDESQGNGEWLALDPSFKARTLVTPEIDLDQTVRGPLDEWLKSSLDDGVFTETSFVAGPSFRDLDNSKELVSEVSREVRAALPADKTIGDLVGGDYPTPVKFDYLPASLPYRVVSVIEEARAVPSRLQARIDISVGGRSTFALPSSQQAEVGEAAWSSTTARIAGKRLTIGYVPSTEADEAVIASYGGIMDTPVYAAELRPVIRLDGEVVASGTTGLPIAYTQRLSITYRMPGLARDEVVNPVYAGAMSALALNFGGGSGKRLEKNAAQFRQASSTLTEDNVFDEGRFGAALSLIGDAYFLQNDAFNALAAQASGVRAQRSLSGGLVATNLTPRFIGSFPLSVRLTGLNMDVDREAQAAVSASGDDSAVDRYLETSGMHASFSESSVFKRSLGGEGVTTGSVLQAAMDQGVPLVVITAANRDQAVPTLNVASEVRAEIVAALERPGASVVVPRDQITMSGWRGSGYVIESAEGRDYRISGGLSGGLISWVADGLNYLDKVWWVRQLNPPEFLDTGILGCSLALAGDGLWLATTPAMANAIWPIFAGVFEGMAGVSLAGFSAFFATPLGPLVLILFLLIVAVVILALIQRIQSDYATCEQYEDNYPNGV